jgi:hypothetical protein
MTRGEIARASTDRLYDRLGELSEDAREAFAGEYDEIEKEIDAREFDDHEPRDYDASDRLAAASEILANWRNER